jgi:hypothetical protein
MTLGDAIEKVLSYKGSNEYPGTLSPQITQEPEVILGLPRTKHVRPGQDPRGADVNPFTGLISAGPEVSDQTMTHEIGHAVNIRDKGVIPSLAQTLPQGVASLFTGETPQYELEAQGLGIDEVAKHADAGDPQAISMLQNIVPMIENEEKHRMKRGEIPERSMEFPNGEKFLEGNQKPIDMGPFLQDVLGKK